MAAPKTKFPRSRVVLANDFVRLSDELAPYRVNVVTSLQNLPSETQIFIVPRTTREDDVFKAMKGLTKVKYFVEKRPRGRSVRKYLEIDTAPLQSPVVAEAAYTPGARARAILRGVANAENDLKDAGGAFDVEEVRMLLRGVSRQAIDKRVNEGSLLAVPGPSGRRRFPALQFMDDGSVVPGLKEVQNALGYARPWAVLGFLINPHDLLGDRRPIDLLRNGQVEQAEAAAKLSGVHAE